MQIPLQITFRHMERTDALEAKIREKAQKLEQFAEHITSCRVTIDLIGYYSTRKGNCY